ncbi:PREDICTED: B3 domain-containing protein REM20-like [Ipomoea nil]|uniref:B3 domain-containing protein REM20-like n=1 Tax=Ipomoea nil TaxID=35883 RepID=UPI0009013191|nr:PREDICTED: B3 domain-containing protein REM20-like [Ipomoea nil]
MKWCIRLWKPGCLIYIDWDNSRVTILNLKQIPVELLEFMPKGLSGSAVLRGLSSRHWTVKLSLEAYRLFINEGWDRFFEENALCKDDFLAFGHCGGGETEKFDVRIFDKHGRERLDVSDAVGLSATNQEIKKEDTSVAFGGKEKGCKYSENNTLSGLQGENLGDGLPPGTSVHTRSVRNRDGPAKIGENLSIGLSLKLHARGRGMDQQKVVLQQCL